MPISESDIEKIAQLAHLEITDNELSIFGLQLAEIVVFFDQLMEVETRSVSNSCDASRTSASHLRPDAVVDSLGQESAGSGAPDFECGYFRVPKIL